MPSTGLARWERRPHDEGESWQMRVESKAGGETRLRSSAFPSFRVGLAGVEVWKGTSGLRSTQKRDICQRDRSMASQG